MDGLVELIFERVPDDAVHRLVHSLLLGADILEISHSEEGNFDLKAIQDFMPFLKEKPAPASIFVRASRLSIGGVPIRNPLVRVLRVDRSNDVIVEFDNGDVDVGDRQSAVTMLASGTKVLAESVGVFEYSCGFEPATDERTRLFSNDKMGPLARI